MIKNKLSLSTIFFIGVMASVFLSMSIFASFWIFKELKNFKAEAEKIRSQYIESKKFLIKTEVEKVIDYVQYQKSLSELKLKSNLSTRVNEAYELALHLYNYYSKTKSKQQIKEIIKETLRPIRFNNKRGYYFAVSLDGVEQLYPTKPEFEGKNVLNLRDSKGNYVIKDEINVIKKYGEGFVIDYWPKPDDNSNKAYKKISFVKYFEPFDWYIGTGEYIDDFEKDIQNEILERIAKIRFGKDGYIFVVSYDGVTLMNDTQRYLIGKNIWNLEDPNGVKVIQEERKAVENPDGDFIYYSWKKPGTDIVAPKISFLKGIKDWQWMIGAGVYVDEIDSLINIRKNQVNNEIISYIFKIIILFILILLAVFIIIKYFSKFLENEINIFVSFFKNSALNNEKIDNKKLFITEFIELSELANEMVDNIKHSHEKLEKSIEEKEILLREVHHRVKNNLQVISSLINLQSIYINDKKIIENLRVIENRIKSMGVIHEKLYQSKNLAVIDFNTYIDDLVNHLIYSYKLDNQKIKLIKKIDNIDLNIDTSIYCGLIINEIISNSFKYAFPDGRSGEIYVELSSKNEDEFLLIAGDNGIGLPEHIDFNKNHRLGLELIKTLSAQLNGNAVIDRKNGTKYIITFKNIKKRK